MKFEYKVISAPKKGVRAKGAKSAEDKFAHALMDVMNELGADGWEYQRTDTLPVEARAGLTGKATVFQNMMVFRRIVTEDHAETPAMIDDLPADPMEVVETYVENHAPPLGSPAPVPVQTHVVLEGGPVMSPPKNQA